MWVVGTLLNDLISYEHSNQGSLLQVCLAMLTCMTHVGACQCHPWRGMCEDSWGVQKAERSRAQGKVGFFCLLTPASSFPPVPPIPCCGLWRSCGQYSWICPWCPVGHSLTSLASVSITISSPYLGPPHFPHSHTTAHWVSPAQSSTQNHITAASDCL
jgi:hypothetical protein